MEYRISLDEHATQFTAEMVIDVFREIGYQKLKVFQDAVIYRGTEIDSGTIDVIRDIDGVESVEAVQ